MSSASIPTSGDEITAEWIVQVLSNNLTSSSKVEVASFEVEDEDKKSGTLSTICRAECLIQMEGKDETERHKIFIKIMPKNERYRQFANGSQMDKTEIRTYQIFLPEMESFELKRTGKSGTRISPKLYAGDFDLKDESRSWYVILEDLGDDHSMPDFSKGLSLEQLTLALQKLGHFHALTHSYGKLNGIKNYEEHFDFFNQIFKDFDSDPAVGSIIDDSLELVKRDLNEIDELKFLIGRLNGFREKMKHVFATLVQRESADVVIHGDIWANNYLFGQNGDKSCFMVDWQFTSTGNPLFDFGPVAFLSMNADATESNLKLIMKVYYEQYRDSALELGLQAEDLLWDQFCKTFLLELMVS